MTFKQALKAARHVYIGLSPAQSGPLTLPVAKLTVKALMKLGYDGKDQEDSDVASWEFCADKRQLWIFFKT